jgi:hypothetical protein
LWLQSQTKILPDSAKPGQLEAKKSKEQDLISLDFLCRFEPSQCDALTPKAKSLSPSFTQAGLRTPALFVRRLGQGTISSDFRKGKFRCLLVREHP